MLIELDLLNPDNDLEPKEKVKQEDERVDIPDPNKILRKQVQTIDGSWVEI